MFVFKVCVCVCVVYTHECSVPEDDARSPEVGIIGGCEPPDVGAGNKHGSLTKTVYF